MAVTGNNSTEKKTANTFSSVKANSGTTGTTQQQGTGNGPTSSTQATGTYYRPEGYTSKYEDALDSVMQQIQGYGDFNYEFEGDNLFKSYRDQYTQLGKQASLDAMGQAAELTGGYGNSYGQQVGQQTYNSYLTSLYDKGLDLRDKAYTTYSDNRSDLYDQYSNLWAAENEDYDRFYDERAFNENARQFDIEAAETQREYDISLAKDYCISILENGGMPSEELLSMAGLTKEDAEELRNKENDPQNSESSSSSSSSGGSNGSSSSGKTYYVNQNLDGSYTYLKKNSDGSLSTVTEDEAKTGNIDTTLVDNANDNSNLANSISKTVGNIVTKGASGTTTNTANAGTKIISNAATAVGTNKSSSTYTNNSKKKLNDYVN